jgi:hypothetical protein
MPCQTPDGPDSGTNGKTKNARKEHASWDNVRSQLSLARLLVLGGPQPRPLLEVVLMWPFWPVVKPVWRAPPWT